MRVAGRTVSLLDGDVVRTLLSSGLGFDRAGRELNLQRVGLYVFGDNPGAIRAYARAGFEVEGVLRRAAYIDGAYSDITVMGCLRDG